MLQGGGEPLAINHEIDSDSLTVYNTEQVDQGATCVVYKGENVSMQEVYVVAYHETQEKIDERNGTISKA